MTDLTKAVRRRVRRDNLTVMLAPDGVYCREHNRRRWLGPVSYGSLLRHCAMVNVEADRRAKLAAKQLRKLAPVRSLL